MTLRGAVFAVAVAGVVGAGGCGGPAASAPHASNVLWITLSGLRTDHLGLYGYARPTDPYLSSVLAPRGRVFLDARARPGSVGAAIAELVTGRTLDDLIREGHPLRDPTRSRILPRALTVAELLRVRGYRCAAFSHASWIGPADREFAQGFDPFELNRPPAQWPPPRLEHRQAGAVFADASEWIHARDPAGDPWFAWVYCQFNRPPLELTDGRIVPWDVDGHFDAMADHERIALRRYDRWRADHIFTEAEAAAAAAVYDASVAYVDRWLEVFFEGVTDVAGLGDTVIVISGDTSVFLPVAGCGFAPCTPEALDPLTPLVIIPPRDAWAGTRDAQRALLSGVGPTMLRFLGIRRPARMRGFPLVPVPGDHG